MKRLVALALTTSLVGLSSSAHAADDFRTLYSLWHAANNAANYREVLPRLLAYRNGPAGRAWRVDYMIGTAECRLEQMSLGVAYLSNVFVYKDAPEDAQQTTRLEIEFCKNKLAAPASPAPLPDSRTTASGQVTTLASVSGKGGFNEIPSNSVGTTQTKPVPVPVEELSKRVFAMDQGPAALTAALALMGSGSKGEVANGFVAVCAQGCVNELVHEVPNCLAQYWSPLKQQFDIQRPEKLIIVYLPLDLRDVPDYARKLHGVELPLGTIAYSVREDLSVVGLMGTGGCGSLAHELVHLSIRANFGDSPAWLEEGLASEVAIAQPAVAGFAFQSSWRDQMLKSHMTQRPTVAQLLGLTWTDFAALAPSSVDKVAATHAMAAVFVRYLDARGKLRDVYFAIRDGRFPESGREPRTDLSIVEEVLGSNAAVIDADLVQWFGTQSR